MCLELPVSANYFIFAHIILMILYQCFFIDEIEWAGRARSFTYPEPQHKVCENLKMLTWFRAKGSSTIVFHDSKSLNTQKLLCKQVIDDPIVAHYIF